MLLRTTTIRSPHIWTSKGTGASKVMIVPSIKVPLEKKCPHLGKTYESIDIPKERETFRIMSALR